MSYLPVSLMNRLNQTDSAVFKLWMLYFQRIHCADYLVLSLLTSVRTEYFKRFILNKKYSCDSFRA